ncbi:MAG: hypothetical protein AAGA18_05455 [Verrucomicrobiota bacterium]
MEEDQNRVLPALDRLVAIDEVSAVFVFNEDNEILAKHMPNHYTDAALVQVAARIQGVLQYGAEIGEEIKESVFQFENYGAMIKLFSDTYTMAVFFDRDAEVALLRQPVNLAILNIDKAVRKVEVGLMEDAARSDLAQAARQAEREIYQVTGDDANGYFRRLSLLANYYLGPLGIEILEHSFREQNLALPIKKRIDMLHIVQYCAEHIANPAHREAYLVAGENLMDRLKFES